MTRPPVMTMGVNGVRHVLGPYPVRPRARPHAPEQLSLVAYGGSKAISVTVQAAAADCPCSDAGRIGVEIYSVSADDTRDITVAIFVCGYTLVADRTRGPAVAVAISADVLTADPARRIAVPISEVFTVRLPSVPVV